MSATDNIAFMKAVADVQRKLDILAFDVEPTDSDLSDTLRELYQQLDDASHTYAFGRPLRREFALVSVPDRPLDEVGER